MSDKQLRELDVEIAKLVFGLVYSNFQWFAGEHGPSVYHKLPAYSTDPAAAMMVLEKVAQKRNEAYDPYCPDATLVIHAPHKDWKNKWIVASDPTHRIIAEADTLPLALCLFAKALFSK